MTALNALSAVSYTHLDVYKRQLAYRVIVDAVIVKCFATFLLSFAIMSFCKNYAIMIDAVIHPELGVPTFSTDGALIHPLPAR